MTDAVDSMPLFGVANQGTPTTAKQLTVQEISMRTARELNRTWHSMLPRTDLGNLLCGNMSVAYGAEHETRWFAVAIYSQPIVASLCDGVTIELRRLAVCSNAPKNTATYVMAATRRLLRAALPHLRKIVSYQAVDVHHGTIYKADNWIPVGNVVDARPQRYTGGNQRATGPLQTTSRKRRWEHSL